MISRTPRVVAWASAVSVLVVVACGGGKGPPRTVTGALASCTADADCVLTTSAGCCNCCPDAPLALPVGEHKRRERNCAVIDCAPCGASIECPKVPPPGHYRAKCQEGTCAAVRE